MLGTRMDAAACRIWFCGCCSILWRRRRRSVGKPLLAMDLRHYKGSMSLDGDGSKPFVVAFYGGDLCPVVHCYRLMLIMVVHLLQIELEGTCAMQVDGEPWMQGPATVLMEPAGQSLMLRANNNYSE